MPDAGEGSRRLGERLGGIIDAMRHRATVRPGRIAIPSERVIGKTVGRALEEERCYFNIIINEMFLKDDRVWAKEFDPMVLSLTEFTYGTETITVPHILGRNVLKGHFTEVIKDQGILISNETIVGPYPYLGGHFSTTIVLCKLQVEDYAHKIFNLVEKASGIVPPAAALGSYMKLAGILYDGTMDILGSEATEPLVGHRKSFKPEIGEPPTAGYYALINMDEGGIRADRLWVKDNRLMEGKDEGRLEPYRDADYVLYSVLPTEERSDEELLDFYKTWLNIETEASRLDPASWRNARESFKVLHSAIMTSNDLIYSHKRTLSRKYQSLMEDRIAHARETARDMGQPVDDGPPELTIMPEAAIRSIEDMRRQQMRF